MNNINLDSVIRSVGFIIIGIVVACAFWGIAKFLFRRKKHSFGQIDNMDDGYEFEEYFAGLLLTNGFEDVEVTKKSGDFGVDVLATKDDVRFAFQTKLYTQPVGVKAVQEAIAGKIYYDCHVGVVATNNSFTSGATQLAEKSGILLWGHDKLLLMEHTPQ